MNDHGPAPGYHAANHLGASEGLRLVERQTSSSELWTSLTRWRSSKGLARYWSDAMPCSAAHSRIAAHQDEGDAELLHRGGEVEAGLSGNARVGNDQVDGLADQHIFGDRDAARLADAKIGGRERPLDDFEDHRIIVHDQDVLGRHDAIDQTRACDTSQAACQHRQRIGTRARQKSSGWLRDARQRCQCGSGTSR
jgi:hypothetical protein